MKKALDIDALCVYQEQSKIWDFYHRLTKAGDV